MNKKILIVDDDIKLTSLVRDYLSNHEFDVRVLHDGHDIIHHVKNIDPCLIILDIMLPGDDGLTLCKRIREHSQVPILMLTARGDDDDKLTGFETGADDYIAKPFNPRELLARMKAILRRFDDVALKPIEKSIRFYFIREWKLDLETYHLINTDGLITVLSSGEFRLLRHLAEHAQKTLSRDQLMEVLAGHDILPTDRTIDVMISRLRKRLNDNAKEPEMIVTVRNMGYQLACDVHSE